MNDELLQGDELIALLDQMENAGMAVTRKWHELWKTAIMYVWNEQLLGIKKNPDWDYIVANYIYPLMMQGIAKLSKNNPKVLGRPWNDEDAEYAEKWQGMIQYVWEQILDMRIDVIYALLDASVFGYAVSKVYWQNKVEWDEKNNRWLGDIRHCLVHPMNFWVDANATRIKNARNLGMVRKVELDWAISQYPDFKEELMAESANSDKYNYYESGFSYGGSSGSVQPVMYQNQIAKTINKVYSKIVSLIFGGGEDNSSSNAVTSETTKHTSKKYVWLKETYFYDDYEEDVKIEDYVPEQELINDGTASVEQGTGIVQWTKTGKPISKEEYPKKTISEYKRPKFPKGRFVVRAGKVILNPETDDQVYKFSRWPFTVMPHHILPHMWQGLNAVELSKGSQDMLNVTIAHLIQHVKVATDPRLIVESGALAKGKNGKPRLITSQAGEIIVVEKGRKDDIGKLEPGRLGPEVFTLVDYLKRDIETQQFMHPTAQGVVNSGHITAQEAARADTNAHDMVAMRAVLLDKWIEGVASNIAELIQEYYDVNRRISIVGTDGQTRSATMSEELKKVEWTLEIEPGSTLPFDEERRKTDYATAYKILGDTIPNPLLEDMLRILNIANRSKVLMKHQQTQLFKQFITISAQAQTAMQQVQQQGATPEQIQVVQQKIMQQVMQLMSQVGQMAAKGAA